jgi:phosphoribosylformylglycinamidine synthase
MVGPWQVPVADCAVTLADFVGFRGEAMSMGERTPLAALDAPASGRMAVGEAITNLLAAPFALQRVKLSCNWMAACSDDPAAPGDDAALYDTVRAVGMELCPALGISVPVGKDSLSMRTRWTEGTEVRQVTAPVSLIVTAFASLDDVRGSVTPQLQPGDTTLILIDLGFGAKRLAGSSTASCSIDVVTTRGVKPAPSRTRRLSATACAMPMTAALSASVAPLVKMMSLCEAPITAATWRRAVSTASLVRRPAA